MRTYPLPLRFANLTFILLPLLGWTQCIELHPGSLLLSGGTTLDVGDYAIPCVADWNGDSRKDLIVGYQYAGKVAMFYNIGSDNAPAFNTCSNLQAAGSDIQHVSGGCGAPAPFVCDFDGDGKRDLLVGTGGDGYVYFYRNTNTDSAPKLAPGVLLMAGGSVLQVPARATPFLYDWDGDGLRDLLCGDGNGGVTFFRNIGAQQSPVFAPGRPVQAGGLALNLGMRSIVRMADWDGDGMKDLLGSSAYGVYWCKNAGSDSNPVLSAPVALSAPAPGTGLVAINTGPRMRLDVVDWNNDGVPDILLGNFDGSIAYYQGYRFAFTQLSAPAGLLEFQWSSAPYLNYRVLTGPNPGSLTNLLATVPSAGRSTAWTNPAPTGTCFYRLQITQ